jgi:hypothetical protein
MANAFSTQIMPDQVGPAHVILNLAVLTSIEKG